MNEDDSSRTNDNTEMLPSGLFCPAIPVTLDEPSSIATIKSFNSAILYYLFLFPYAHNLIIEFHADTRVFIPSGLTESVAIELAKAV